MRGLDANILVRYLVRDDERQAEKASAYIQEATSKGESFFINSMVLCELIWVLDACYGFRKKEIVDVLEKILVTKQFEFEQKEIIRHTLSDYAQGKGDFSDYLIGRINHAYGCINTVSFDRALKNASTFEILE
jgi:predicted nucleic-acid-binding protein